MKQLLAHLSSIFHGASRLAMVNWVFACIPLLLNGAIVPELAVPGWALLLPLLPLVSMIFPRDLHLSREVLFMATIQWVLGIFLYMGWAPPLMVLMFFPISLHSMNLSASRWFGIYLGGTVSSGMLLLFVLMLKDQLSGDLMGVEPSVLIISSLGLVIINARAYYQFHLLERQQMKHELEMRARLEWVHDHFSKLILNAESESEALWLVAQHCIPQLGLIDCVIYLPDPKRKELMQIAAFGDKNPTGKDIKDPITIPMGKGIVGKVAVSGNPVRVGDTRLFPDYIQDDAFRLSEMAVPIILNGQVEGVIDSEHPDPYFFEEEHVSLLSVIASICANKMADLRLSDARVEKLEDRQRMERLREVEHLRTAFINNLSHDLRTPLTLIQGPLADLERNRDPQVQQLASIARKNADRLKDMMASLMDLHRFERGATELQMQRVDFDQFLSDWSGLFLHEADRRRITFDLDFEQVGMIRCDAVKIGHIVENLLSNAFKFTPDGGKIRMLVRFEAGRLKLKVEDSGPGIPPDFREKIFQRFFKIDPDTHNSGTGIGLSLVKAYVELMEGKLRVDEGDFGGARFEILLPVEAAHDHPMDMPVVSFAPQKPKLVLVEDHPEMLEYVETVLSEEFEVYGYTSGEAAGPAVQELIPEILVTDLMLGTGMSGEELCRQVKSQWKTDHIPILALSAKTEMESRIQLYELGADNYLTKPFEPQELVAVCLSLVEQRRKLQERFKENSATPTHSELGINRVVALIRNHLDNPELSPPFLCKELGMNRNQLQRKVKGTCGMTPVELIRNVRLDAAREMLLKAPELTVSEIAYACGFNHLAYFSKMFKEKFGQTPSQVSKQKSR
ncbi:helix-turn-helix domain-containing protein [Pontibacter sp. G13]|uniref:helix-turn-helix domain-containing protein n=1 Tax=Pontibacter sp. G13 TaxID=3074898 RepID=UPI00288C3318|nr:helix-turn-helix domain-containing protein [Pontibacter sp. G13]WNJ20330.1 helix-turn-helix domain-containing protein [Pontibacter sp. G13]